TSTDMVVREGSNVTFRCSATGSPAPNITWRREDGQIFLGNDQKVSPMIWIQNQLVGARVGQSMTLECQSEAYPKSINYWTKDKAEIIAQDGRYEPIFTDNAYKVTMKLTIRSVTPADFGTYKCVSRNSLGDTDGSIKLYEITSGNEHGTRGEDSEYRGKLKKNSSNNLLDGNQDMLKERDLKLRGRKDNGANGDEDYDESGASQTKCTTATTSMTMVIVTLVLCFHHRHPQLQILHPA
ncbi:hypothetical protein PV328_008925, partial [Microctonus aethiopoides]